VPACIRRGNLPSIHNMRYCWLQRGLRTSITSRKAAGCLDLGCLITSRKAAGCLDLGCLDFCIGRLLA